MDGDTTRTCFLPWLVPPVMLRVCKGLGRVKLFIDDIVRFSKNGGRHVCDLRWFLERLTKLNLKVAPNKALLGAAKIIFLGHKISSVGVGPDPDRRTPTPTSTSCRAFLF
ncbi:unnamed protein product [Ascophyllum nodosum]